MVARPTIEQSGRAFVQDSDLTIHVGDVRTVLPSLEAGSVDCCVTSPPYLGLRDYGSPLQIGLEPTIGEYVETLVSVFREVRRLLSDTGTLWLNLGDSYNAYNGGAGPGSKLSKTQTEARPRLESGFGLQQKELKPKDLLGVPWRVAFALQADGWYLRSDIIWAKPNPMPESVTDRPTKAHEYVFLLSKRPRYWFDQEAVREPSLPASIERMGKGWNGNEERGWVNGKQNHLSSYMGSERAAAGALAGRNVRSVWEIATQPYPEAHFATFPEELPRRCILAGCPTEVCGTCGKPRERIMERERVYDHTTTARQHSPVGWSDCGHDDYRPGVVLDPFLGSGTTALVARKHGRRCVGVELSEKFARLSAQRCQQLSLLAG